MLFHFNNLKTKIMNTYQKEADLFWAGYIEANTEEVLAGNKSLDEVYAEGSRLWKVKYSKLWRDDNKEGVRAKNELHYKNNKELFKIYYQKNKEKHLNRQRVYRSENKEKVLENQRRYRDLNKKDLVAKARVYREANRARINAKQREYRAKKKILNN